MLVTWCISIMIVQRRSFCLLCICFGMQVSVAP